MKTIQVRITNEEHTKLKLYATERGESITNLVKDALELHMDKIEFYRGHGPGVATSTAE